MRCNCGRRGESKAVKAAASLRDADAGRGVPVEVNLTFISEQPSGELGRLWGQLGPRSASEMTHPSPHCRHSSREPASGRENRDQPRCQERKHSAQRQAQEATPLVPTDPSPGRSHGLWCHLLQRSIHQSSRPPWAFADVWPEPFPRLPFLCLRIE